jgi:hypothetical protein
MSDSYLSHYFQTWLGKFDTRSQSLYIKVSRTFVNNIYVIANLQALNQRHELLLHPHNCCEMANILHPFSRQLLAISGKLRGHDFYKVLFGDLYTIKILTYDDYIECCWSNYPTR